MGAGLAGGGIALKCVSLLTKAIPGVNIVSGILSIAGAASSIIGDLKGGNSSTTETETDTYSSDSHSQITARWSDYLSTSGVTSLEGYNVGRSTSVSNDFRYAPIGSFVVDGAFGTVDYFQLEFYDRSDSHRESMITYVISFEPETADHHNHRFASSATAGGFYMNLFDLYRISEDKIASDREAILGGDGSLDRPYLVNNRAEYDAVHSIFPAVPLWLLYTYHPRSRP